MTVVDEETILVNKVPMVSVAERIEQIVPRKKRAPFDSPFLYSRPEGTRVYKIWASVGVDGLSIREGFAEEGSRDGRMSLLSRDEVVFRDRHLAFTPTSIAAAQDVELRPEATGISEGIDRSQDVPSGEFRATFPFVVSRSASVAGHQVMSTTYSLSFHVTTPKGNVASVDDISRPIRPLGWVAFVPGFLLTVVAVSATAHHSYGWGAGLGIPGVLLLAPGAYMAFWPETTSKHLYP
jgi:hypothetical protein